MALIGILWGALHQPQTKFILSIAALSDLELEQSKWTFLNKPAKFTFKFSYGKISTFKGLDEFQLVKGTMIPHYCE
ncbi:hypothetical protein J3R82DRAFT_10070 [Butyriboletus roseoflavus]|nr:hypothetical protein J3R82DRAFT_10070 [Butyriboletus roseoflavus]